VAGNELTHPAGHGVEHHEGGHDEPVLAPDQVKPLPFRRLTPIAAFVSAALLVIMAFFGNHQGDTEKIYLVGIAAIIVLVVIGDFFLRKAGLRN
jgi:hypothetical protein